MQLRGPFVWQRLPHRRPGLVEQEDLVDGFELGVVGEFPDKFFVAGDFEEHGLLADVAVAEVVADERVAVGETLASGGELEGIPGDVLFADFPDDGILFIEFLNLATFAATDEEVAIGETNGGVHVAGNLDFVHDLGIAIDFHDFVVALETDEVMPIGEFASTAKLFVGGNVGGGGEFNFLGHLAIAIHLHQPAGSALGDEDATIGQWLAGMDFGARRGSVLPGDFFFLGQLHGSRGEAEKDVPIRQFPAILRGGAGVFPFDFSFG